MKDWKKVQGSQETKPAEFDTTSSAVAVYQRRNVQRVTVTNADGTKSKLWEYDERQMTHQEYAALRMDAISAGIAAIEDALCEFDAEEEE